MSKGNELKTMITNKIKEIKEICLWIHEEQEFTLLLLLFIFCLVIVVVIVVVIVSITIIIIIIIATFEIINLKT